MSYRDLRGPITGRAAERERDQLFDRPAQAISPELVALFKRIDEAMKRTAPAQTGRREQTNERITTET